MKGSYYKGLYMAAAACDISIGLGFLIFYKWIFELFNIEQPDNPAYVSLPAMLIGAYGISLFLISLKPKESGRMIIYVIIVKLGYIGVVTAYFLVSRFEYIPWIFIVFVGFDLIWAALFLESLRFARSD